jgi:anti-sigma B factor antagonist
MAENFAIKKIEDERITSEFLNCYKLAGRIDAETSQEFELTMRLLQKQEKYVVFDFSELNYINSFGIGILVDLQKNILKNEGIVKICGLSPSIKKIFQITYLTRVFEIFENFEQALDSFHNKAAGGE